MSWWHFEDKPTQYIIKFLPKAAVGGGLAILQRRTFVRVPMREVNIATH
jgi:hypothetical protein